MFICVMILRCTGTLKSGLSLDRTVNLTTTVVYSYKSLKNDVKPIHSLAVSSCVLQTDKKVLWMWSAFSCYYGSVISTHKGDISNQ